MLTSGPYQIPAPGDGSLEATAPGGQVNAAWVQLDNASPWLCRVTPALGGLTVWMPAWTSILVDLGNGPPSVTITALQALDGASADNTVTASWWLPNEQPPALPAPLVAQAIAAAVSGLVQAEIDGDVPVVNPAGGVLTTALSAAAACTVTGSDPWTVTDVPDWANALLLVPSGNTLGGVGTVIGQTTSLGYGGAAIPVGRGVPCVVPIDTGLDQAFIVGTNPAVSALEVWALADPEIPSIPEGTAIPAQFNSITYAGGAKTLFTPSVYGDPVYRLDNIQYQVQGGNTSTSVLLLTANGADIASIIVPPSTTAIAEGNLPFKNLFLVPGVAVQAVPGGSATNAGYCAFNLALSEF